MSLPRVKLYRLCTALLGILVTQWVTGQPTVVSGKVTDAATGDPIPFANVVFVGTSIGITTDFNGYYQITTNNPRDSLSASYIGYLSKIKPVQKNTEQVINFQLYEDIQELQEVVFVAEENPAWAIMRSVIANKERNDKRNLSAYEYESYNKIEIDLDNLTEKFRERKLVQKIKKVIDSVDQIAGEDGQAVLPIFISESISKYYYRNNPVLRKEHILKTKITGVGVQDGTLISQLIGSSFQEYNFYQNWLNLWEKEFVSPIADGWKTYYETYLMDSLYIGNHFCYRIDVYPKSEQDLAFTGTLWIDRETYALKQVDLSVNEVANLNFIEKLRIQQELAPTETGPWIPLKSRVLTDFRLLSEFGFKKQSAGFLTKFYTSNQNIVVNQPQDIRFFDMAIELEEDATIKDEAFWDANRHDPLTNTEKNVISMIDTLRNIKAVKNLTNLITWISTGYIPVGKLDLGPYPLFYAFNNVEEHRFRMGGRTNIDFSNRWIFRGYGAYGTQDARYKYGAGVDFLWARRPWTKIGFYRTKDIQQVGLTFDDVSPSVDLLTFEAFFRNRDHFLPYYLTETRFRLLRQIKRGFLSRITVRHKEFQPINLDSTFNYGYLVQPELGNASSIQNDFEVTELKLDLRYGKDEIWVINDNDRVSLGPVKAPVFNLSYVYGVDGLFNEDFEYHKVSLSVNKKLKLGFFGVSNVRVTGEKIFGQVPLPILKGHVGNESPFFIGLAYNTMGFSEFVSDQYLEFRFQHKFEGFLLNRVPLFKKLKWRLVTNANILTGDVSGKNKALHSALGANGLPNAAINDLGDDPYIEVGYGIENIFKLLRIDAFHRLTHLNNRTGDKFALKFSFEFSF